MHRAIKEARQWITHHHNFLLCDTKTEAIVVAALNRTHVQNNCAITDDHRDYHRMWLNNVVTRFLHVLVSSFLIIQHIKYQTLSHTDVCKTLVHALVTSLLDYSNAVLYCITVALVTNP